MAENESVHQEAADVLGLSAAADTAPVLDERPVAEMVNQEPVLAEALDWLWSEVPEDYRKIIATTAIRATLDEYDPQYVTPFTRNAVKTAVLRALVLAPMPESPVDTVSTQLGQRGEA